MTGTLRRPKRGLWRRIVDFALTDVNTLVDGGLDGAAIERLEEVLLEADFGVDTTLELVEALERAASRGAIATEGDLRDTLRARLAETLAAAEAPAGGGRPADSSPRREGPGVLLLVGVNGVGKTTTAAKLAARLQAEGGRVLLAAADTFRAGAQEQLRAWAERLGTDFVGGTPGADPASVAFDAVAAARARNADWVLVDTAGRLHTQDDLMRELVKIDRVLGRQVEGAPDERLLVVDATSGQNVMNQARQFGASLGLTGLVLAKFDSTARAGTVVAVVRELSVPVRYLGVGESAQDLEAFSPDRYLDKILAPEP
ncbi:MAG: signal recognition particle-docking protein FtsY [Gemmatimonadales bacterium]|nr:signal recognition particle-docking protein FtsY [Gemmatimonadales bacterium]MYG48038.1 signal recognition particle-docking protein FtsY [Gemmatimonadales bacterium]MYK00913.1 signal recognition particle-docking protein FtsY [Candidatus Palauibacter ramosifaciens]